MKAFILGVAAVIGIAVIAALVSTTVDQSARHVYQAPDGSVRLSGQ